ncbi:MAG: hypothetical protein ABIL39_12220 [candidate division WOR-3 bacterium]
MKLNFKRLAWDIFVLLYAGLFFYNCLRPYENWFFPYLYTMLLVLWLCKEYYQKNLFFQPTHFPNEAHNYLLRGLFALFFYSSFVFGIATIVWWQRYRIFKSPLLPLAGIFLLGLGIYQREKALHMNVKDKATVEKFYESLGLIIFSMALGYDSYFLLIYGLVIGVPLIILQMQHYIKRLQIKAN